MKTFDVVSSNVVLGGSSEPHKTEYGKEMTGLSRRNLLAGVAALYALPSGAQEGDQQYRTLQPRTYDDGLIPNFSFELIEMDLNGGLGVFALDTQTGRSSGWGENYRFPVNSTFKFLLVAGVLQRIDARADQLDRLVEIQQTDIVSWSPVVEAAAGQAMSIRDLCQAALTRSDNAAANLLLASLGGPSGLTKILRENGDDITRIDRFEPDINDVAQGDERDSTTPFQMVKNMEQFLLGEKLSPSSRTLLSRWMVANTTGTARIRAGTPDGWAVGDRTGTGRNVETSTIAAIYPPDRAPLLMAVYVAGSNKDQDFQSERHAELARIATTNLLLPPYDPYPDD